MKFNPDGTAELTHGTPKRESSAHISRQGNRVSGEESYKASLEGSIKKLEARKAKLWAEIKALEARRKALQDSLP
jgi:septal ring factor EnvC (AmiA/AmiB activator)